MFNKKQIILSYDYELFFGERSGTVQKSLIEPTSKLMDAMESVGFRGNFFVDWQMLKYLKLEHDDRCKQDYILIENQLKDIIRRGHRIELHIHPHWVDAKYNGDGTWDFSIFRHYSLNSFSQSEITELFVEGVNLLSSIAHQVDQNYRIIAFRAGGWAIQPFDKLKLAFKTTGLLIDSSVACGAHGKNQYSYFDFRKISAQDCSMYRFSHDVTIEDNNGEYLEIPISSYKRNTAHRIIDKLFRCFFSSSQTITDGTHIRNDLKCEGKSKRTMVTMSKISPITSIFSIINQPYNLVTVIDHPKDFTPSAVTCLKWLSVFCKSKNYKDLL